MGLFSGFPPAPRGEEGAGVGGFVTRGRWEKPQLGRGLRRTSRGGWGGETKLGTGEMRTEKRPRTGAESRERGMVSPGPCPEPGAVAQLDGEQDSWIREQRDAAAGLQCATSKGPLRGTRTCHHGLPALSPPSPERTWQGMTSPSGRGHSGRRQEGEPCPQHSESSRRGCSPERTPRVWHCHLLVPKVPPGRAGSLCGAG